MAKYKDIRAEEARKHSYVERQKAEAEENCTFAPKISRPKPQTPTKMVPRGFDANIARMRVATNKREELKSAHENLGKLSGESESVERIDGKIVADPFKFSHSKVARENKERTQKDRELMDKMI